MNELFLNFRDLVLSKLTRDTSIVLFGNLISSSLAVVFTILAARLLGPEEWGIVAAVGSLMTILVALGDLGMGAALFRFVSKRWSEGARKQAQKTINIVWSLRLVTVLVVVVILILFSGVFSKLFLNTDNQSLIMFTALGVLGALLIDFQIATSEARQEWKKAALFISLTNSLRVLFVVVFSPTTLMSILFIFTGSSFAAYLISVFWQTTPIVFKTDWPTTVRELLPFSGFMGLNRIVSSINSRVDVILLIQILGAYEAGIYGAANRLAIGVPLILGSFATVLAPRFASFSGKKDLNDFFRRSFSIALLMTVGLVFGVFVAPFVVSLFGPEYQRSAFILQLLFIAFLPSTISVPAVNFVIYAMHKPQIITTLSLIELPIIIGFNLWFIPRIGVVAPVIALGIANIITMLVAFSATWWFLGKKL